MEVIHTDGEHFYIYNCASDMHYSTHASRFHRLFVQRVLPSSRRDQRKLFGMSWRPAARIVDYTSVEGECDAREPVFS
jgi:hypothetical protein